MKCLIPFLMCFAMSSAWAGAWQCESDVEVQCENFGCAANAEFTPITMSFLENGEFGVCAYSGCWEGIGKVVINDPFLVISSSAAEWSSEDAIGSEAVAIIYDRRDDIALLKVASFAMPLVCNRVDAE